MCDFKSSQAIAIVQHVSGKDKLLREPKTGRAVPVYRDMQGWLVEKLVTDFCKASATGQVEVVDPPAETNILANL